MIKKIIGITGALASGKTTASKFFEDLGAYVIDADAITHEILRNDRKVIDAIVLSFGEDVLDDKGDINRKELASIVFPNKNEIKKLTNIVHPPIIEKIKKLTKKSDTEIVVIDAPLLIEVGLNSFVDIVVVVVSSPETLIKRAVCRGISEFEAKNILKNQMNSSDKVKFADYVIENEGKIEKIKEGVEKIWQSL